MSSIVDFPQEGTIGQSLRPKRYDLEIFRGDSFDITVACKNAADETVDLTGVTAIVKFVKIGGAVPAIQPTADVDEVNGTIRIYIYDTSTLAAGSDYAWDLQLVEGTAPNQRKRTYIGGVLSITEDLTP